MLTTPRIKKVSSKMEASGKATEDESIKKFERISEVGNRHTEDVDNTCTGIGDGEIPGSCGEVKRIENESSHTSSADCTLDPELTVRSHPTMVGNRMIEDCSGSPKISTGSSFTTGKKTTDDNSMRTSMTNDHKEKHVSPVKDKVENTVNTSTCHVMPAELTEYETKEQRGSEMGPSSSAIVQTMTVTTEDGQEECMATDNDQQHDIEQLDELSVSEKDSVTATTKQRKRKRRTTTDKVHVSVDLWHPRHIVRDHTMLNELDICMSVCDQVFRDAMENESNEQIRKALNTHRKLTRKRTMRGIMEAHELERMNKEIERKKSHLK